MSIPRDHPAPPKLSRILVVDDHPVVREMLALAIAREETLGVCAAVGSVAEALVAFEHYHPDLVVVDIALPDGSGLDLIKEIHGRAPDTRMLVFSTHDEQLYGDRALRAGAQGYLMKSESPGKLIEAIERLLSGKLAVSEALSQKLLANASHKTRAKASAMQLLSERELEVFELIGRGRSTKEIADHTGLGSKTIDTYRQRIKEKLQIHKGPDLIAHAARWVAEGP